MFAYRTIKNFNADNKGLIIKPTAEINNDFMTPFITIKTGFDVLLIIYGVYVIRNNIHIEQEESK